MGPMVLSIRLDRADRIARERRKAKQFWPTPGVSLTSARACMAGRLCPPRYPKAQAGCSAVVRLVRSAVRTERPAGRSAHGSSKGSRAGPSPACATGFEETIQHLVGFAGRGSRHPSASCPVKKEGIPSRVMRCDGCVFGKRRICRSGVRVKSIMRSIHLGCTHMPGCAHDLTAERQIWMSA